MAKIIGGLGGQILMGTCKSDKIYGDLVNHSIKIKQNTSDGSFNNIATILTTGNDTLDGKKGNDKLFGDLQDLKISVKQGASNGSFNQFAPAITAGDDTLDGKGGNDRLYGDLRNMNIRVKQEVTDDGSTNSVTFVGAFPIGVAPNFVAGDDILNGGYGKDQLYGDLYDLRLSVKQDTSDANFAVNNFSMWLVMGHDLLNGGYGKDQLYGDLKNLKMSIKQEAEEGIFVLNLSNPLIVMGHDTLNGGDGKDILYGDLKNLKTSVKQEAEDNGSSNFIFATFTMGNDTLNGGDDKDTLYGDLRDLELSVKQEAEDGGVNTSFFAFVMGSDILNGNDGNDILFGDLRELELSLKQELDADPGSFNSYSASINMGGDTLVGGNGNDFLNGDALEYTLLSDSIVVSSFVGQILISNPVILLTDPISTVQWGNDTLEGGSGADIFDWVFAHTAALELVMQGNDLVIDFNPLDGDILRFENVIDSNGDTIVNLDDVEENLTVKQIDTGGPAAVDSTLLEFFDSTLTVNHGSILLQDFLITDISDIAANVEVIV